MGTVNLIYDYFPELTEEQRERFARLEGLYREWNEKINVISRKDMDEFFAYTKQKFCNLINKQEQTEVEESIWKQINANGGQENDYVKFSLVRKDGTQVTVFDHGRIVENIYYGRVFYVLLLNEKQIHLHYDKKSECHI